MKTKKLLTILGVGAVAFSIASCGGNVTPTPDPTPDPKPSDGVDPTDLSENVTISMAVNYDKNTGLKYNQSSDYTTPKGTVIKSGSFKPVWTAMQTRLNFTIDDKTTSDDKEVNRFKSDWDTAPYADIACGNVSDIVSSSVKGTSESILNLKDYLDIMPNFSKFLEENPIVKMSIETADHDDNSDTGIYYLPYFDGFDDLERTTMIRADWVKKVLDDDITSAALDTAVIWKSSSYTPTESIGEVKVDVTRNNAKTSITKKAVDKSIITLQNELSDADKTGAKLVSQLRDYLKDRYANASYSKLSDIFLGTDAAYDADEMIALMRVVKSLPQYLTGSAENEIITLLPRQAQNSRAADLIRWGGHMWGVRGLESRSGYLYFDKDGNLHDARGEEGTVKVLENLHKLYSEGLIMADFLTTEGYGGTTGKWADLLLGNSGVKDGAPSKYYGFMEYEYVQSQGAYNLESKRKDASLDFRPIISAVADWDDGTEGNYIHFTESWRSVKTQGWCLNASLKDDKAKLARALAIVDYFYSEEGHELNSFGPAEEGYTDGTFDYQGKQVAKVSATAAEQINTIAKGSYTDYFRKYVGATLPIGYVKEQGMEYQVTADNAKAGLDVVNAALTTGSFEHVKCSVDKSNMFYTISPSAWFLSAGDSTTVTELENSSKLGSIHSNGSGNSMWNNYIIYGFGGTAGSEKLLSTSEYLTQVNDTWNLKKLLQIYQDAWSIMNA